MKVYLADVDPEPHQLAMAPKRLTSYYRIKNKWGLSQSKIRAWAGLDKKRRASK